MESTEQSKVKYRSYTFKTSTSWTGGVAGSVAAPGRPPLAISPPVEIKGEPGTWTPEDLFVASVEACHMATFLAYAARHSLTVLAYRSHANGVLELIDGDFRFTRIVIFPTITVDRQVSETDVHAILQEAQRHCLVANSIASIVEVSPTIVMQ
jgi:organic hydroperoxide reductase OsmC/OhrA